MARAAPAVTPLPIHVLIVDDNVHMRAIIREILRNMGVTWIKEAADSTEALSILRDYEIDIALIDIALPGLDGIRLTHEIRNGASSPNPYLPIIIVSGHSSVQAASDARDAGATEFLVKPITSRGLFDRLATVVERPRPFVRCATYFGPERRRRVGGVRYTGPERRAKTDDETLEV